MESHGVMHDSLSKGLQDELKQMHAAWVKCQDDAGRCYWHNPGLLPMVSEAGSASGLRRRSFRRCARRACRRRLDLRAIWKKDEFTRRCTEEDVRARVVPCVAGTALSIWTHPMFSEPPPQEGHVVLVDKKTGRYE